MPLRHMPRPGPIGPIPTDLADFLCEADRRIRRFQRRNHLPAFIPCDFAAAFGILQSVAAQAESAGTLFCEWGSGFGVVACLAALLEFDACGIEVDATLVSASQRLAADFELPVEFVHGSFIPADDPLLAQPAGSFAWLTTSAPPAHEELGLATEDFGIIFAYPWPDEERALA